MKGFRLRPPKLRSRTPDYHDVPLDWQPQQVLERYRERGGQLEEVLMRQVLEQAHPLYAHLPQMRNLTALMRLEREPALGLALDYLERDLICSGSGYTRTALARALGRVHLLEPEQRRFAGIVLGLLERGEHRQEMRAYFRLWQRFFSLEDLRQLEEIVKQRGANLYMQRWLEVLRRTLIPPP